MQTTPTFTDSVGRMTLMNSPSGWLSVCVDEVSSWMSVNRLQLNTAKAEVLWCSYSRRQHQIPTKPVRIGPTSILPVSSVRDLGVYLDANATMTTHVKATCSVMLRRTPTDPQRAASLSQYALLTLIRALVNCQQGRLLLLRVDRCLQSSPEQTTVYSRYLLGVLRYNFRFIGS